MKNKHNHSKKNYTQSNKIISSRNKTDKKNSDTLLAIEHSLNKYGIYIFLSLALFIGFIIFRDFILLHKLYLFKDIGSDSINANYPGMLHISNYLRSDGIPKWSFNQGMGQNIFPQSIADPFSLLLFFIGGNHLGYGIAYMEFCKIICAGLFFYLFLKKIKITAYAAILGSLLFSYSGFIILGSCWNIFSTEAVYLALLLYSFEKLYQDNNLILFPVAISLVAINQPFDLFIMGLFLLVYIIFRLFEDNDSNFKKIFILFSKIIGLGILGVAIGFFFILGDIIQILESPRVGGEASFFHKLMSKPILGFEGEDYGPGYFVTTFMRFFSSDMIGTGSNFKGWYNYLEAPLFYCGVINLLLFPQIFQFLDKRKKIIYAILIAIFIIPVIFPFFRYAFWLFTGDYYRIFSFFVAFILLLNSIKTLHFINQTNKVNLVPILITLIILLIILYYPYQTYNNINILNNTLQDFAAVFLIIYAFLIYLLQFKNIKPIIQSLLVLFVIIELIYFSDVTVNNRPVITGIENKQKIGYNDYTIDAVNYLNSKDKSFFRINKEYYSGLAIHSSMNDAKVQNFKGTPSYFSFNQQYYIKFLQGMNIIHGNVETETRWAPGLTGIPLLHGMASIKYTLTKNNKSVFLNYGYDSIYSIGDVKILKNKYYLPLGFTYDRYISNKDFKKLSPQQKSITINKAFVIDDSIYKINGISKFDLKDTNQNYSWIEFGNDIAKLKSDTLNITKQSQNNIKGNIKIEKTKMLFFSIPFDKGWTVVVDGKNAKPILTNIGFIGLLLEKGTHSVELIYNPPYFQLGAIISLIAVAIFIFLILINLKKIHQNKLIKTT